MPSGAQSEVGRIERILLKHARDAFRDDTLARIPMGELGRLEDIMGAVLFLASPQAEWASGAILDFNGASYLRM